MRIELLHPMIVGFPISFLLGGSFVRLLAFFFKAQPVHTTLLSVSWVMILVGLFSGFAAVFTGELAHDVVDELLCDHRVFDLHQRFAFLTLFLFFAALLLDKFQNQIRFFGPISQILYWAGASFLLVTGSYGGKLVFEQGAAVQQICKGSERKL